MTTSYTYGELVPGKTYVWTITWSEDGRWSAYVKGECVADKVATEEEAWQAIHARERIERPKFISEDD